MGEILRSIIERMNFHPVGQCEISLIFSEYTFSH